MLQIELNDQIKSFVKNFGVVRMRHLKRFFSDWEIGVYEHAILHLTGNNILHAHVDDIVSLVYPRQLSSPLYTYFNTLKCLDALVGIVKSSEVVWCGAAQYPLEVCFLTVEDELYDMTWIDAKCLNNKWGLLQGTWQRMVPPGENDCRNHIAVVPSVDVAQKLRDLPFSQFVVVDANGGVLGIYDNE